jgi:PBP1b-binding outer membrane lipoprotein LpoB
MINVRVLAAILSAGLLAGCSSLAGASRGDTISQIRPEPEVLTVAQDVGFDYIGNLRRAENGDIEATVALINFSIYTDAAASLAHGWVLLDLKQMIGRNKFASFLARATNAGRTSALEYMDVARKYR